MRHLLRLAPLGILLLGLAGCFVSDAPLIAPDAAAHPFERLTFRAAEKNGEVQTLTRHDDDYHLTIPGEDDHAFLRLAAAGDDTYVAALWAPEDDGTETQVLYALLVADVPARRVSSYAGMKPDDFTPTTGLVPCRREVCVADLEAYVAYARSRVAAGPPDVVYDILSIE